MSSSKASSPRKTLHRTSSNTSSVSFVIILIAAFEGLVVEAGSIGATTY